MSKVLERGDIYFFYRPRKGEPHPEGWEELQRAYLVLSPDGGDKHRLIVIGHKKLPEIVPGKATGEERVWGFVDETSRRPEELVDKLEAPAAEGKAPEALRRLPRPAGEGRYALVEHEDHTHLAYALELPEWPGQVQQELGIKDQASYVISVKNPEQPSPMGLEDKPQYPQELQELFDGRKFVSVSRPDLLDYEHTEILLIGAREDAERELGIKLAPERETEATAEIFRGLKLGRRKEPLAPLFKGERQ